MVWLGIGGSVESIIAIHALEQPLFEIVRLCLFALRKGK
jgi:hypothetical protein